MHDDPDHAQKCVPTDIQVYTPRGQHFSSHVEYLEPKAFIFRKYALVYFEHIDFGAVPGFLAGAFVFWKKRVFFFKRVLFLSHVLAVVFPGRGLCFLEKRGSFF